ncbi:hypothetical protein F4776DRAFT_619318 [Hypoxylon sp. NC0597]|nr:hypothetical protein F4776DRAFT_619318 [Hypoxylon sp. NC0597]
MINPWGHLGERDDEILRVTTELRNMFWDNPILEFEKYIASGFRAATVLVRRRESELDGRTHRRLVLKRCLTRRGKSRRLTKSFGTTGCLGLAKDLLIRR